MPAALEHAPAPSPDAPEPPPYAERIAEKEIRPATSRDKLSRSLSAGVVRGAGGGIPIPTGSSCTLPDIIVGGAVLIRCDDEIEQARTLRLLRLWLTEAIARARAAAVPEYHAMQAEVARLRSAARAAAATGAPAAGGDAPGVRLPGQAARYGICPDCSADVILDVRGAVCPHLLLAGGSPPRFEYCTGEGKPPTLETTEENARRVRVRNRHR